MHYFVANILEENGEKFSLFVTEGGSCVVVPMRPGSTSHLLTFEDARARALKFQDPAFRMRHDPQETKRDISYL